MSKKPSLSIQCKQNNILATQENTAAHSLSRKKHYLSIVTPSQRDHKPIKTLKQIKRIAQGIKTTPVSRQTHEVVTKRKVIPHHELHSFISEHNTWKRDLTINVKPLETAEKWHIECSARTKATKFQSSDIQIPQTPINRLLLQPCEGFDY